MKEVKNTHGINFLKTRETVLIVNETNQNDVVKLMGNAHSTSINDVNTWIYFERNITKGKLHKLGRNVLQTNNILELKFDKYGVLEKKIFYDSNNMKKIKYTDKKTANTFTEKSFVDKFLQSVKQKMYGNR